MSSTHLAAPTPVKQAEQPTNPDALATADLARILHKELKPSTEVCRFLVERAARLMVRLNGCMRVDQVIVDASGRVDTSREAVLAWKYEQDAERSLRKALDMIDELERRGDLVAASQYYQAASRELASSSKAAARATTPAPATPKPAPPAAVAPPPREPDFLDQLPRAPYTNRPVTNDVPFAIIKKA